MAKKGNDFNSQSVTKMNHMIVLCIAIAAKRDDNIQIGISINSTWYYLNVVLFAIFVFRICAHKKIQR